MSLGKLLTTGKSLVGLRSGNSRYHLQKGALPKFGSAKNPFASRSSTEPTTPLVEREPQLPKLTPAEVAAANLKRTQALPVLSTPEPASAPAPLRATSTVLETKPVKPAEAVKVSSAVDGWLKKINPMVWLGSRKPAMPKPATAPRFSQTHGPVQGELSLDNIKVMRNDLSETDMEIVQAKARPAVPAASGSAPAAALAAPQMPSARRALDYLNERLLGKH